MESLGFSLLLESSSRNSQSQSLLFCFIVDLTRHERQHEQVAHLQATLPLPSPPLPLTQAGPTAIVSHRSECSFVLRPPPRKRRLLHPLDIPSRAHRSSNPPTYRITLTRRSSSPSPSSPSSPSSPPACSTTSAPFPQN